RAPHTGGRATRRAARRERAPSQSVYARAPARASNLLSRMAPSIGASSSLTKASGVAVVTRSDTHPRSAFGAQPHWWIAEGAFSWLGGCGCLSKAYEYQVELSEALISAALSHLLLRRLTRLPVPSAPRDGFSHRF